MKRSNDDPSKLSSEEAAALLVSGGRTTDASMAHIYDEKFDLNMDALQRAHLRRMMGFDFEIKIREKKLVISSRIEPYVTTWCGYNGDLDEKGVDKLVEACLRLKKKFEAQATKETAE